MRHQLRNIQTSFQVFGPDMQKTIRSTIGSFRMRNLRDDETVSVGFRCRGL